MKDCTECHRPCYPDEYKCPECGDIVCSEQCLTEHTGLYHEVFPEERGTRQQHMLMAKHNLPEVL